MVPKVSVLIPVYNAEAYVGASVQSILAQTYQNFELIVIDDGSTDGSCKVIQDWATQDDRIRFISRSNRGMARTLNEMLGLAKGELIARLDADDLACPDRLQKQVAYMDAHCECGVLGSGVVNIDAEGDPLNVELFPTIHEEIEQRMLRGQGGIIHPSTMLRRSVVVEHGGYSTNCPVVEDQELWLRLSLHTRLANLAEPLIQYRVHSGNMSFTGAREAGRRLADVLVRAHGDRRLPVPEFGDWVGVSLVEDWERRRQWAWSAVQSGNLTTAQKHAWRLLRQKPTSRAAWILFAFSYFPKQMEWFRVRLGRERLTSGV